MKRADGQNPFEPKIYNRPATNIQSMLELRAFCADFFEQRIRSSTNITGDHDFVSFVALITDSPSYFARARAVIPELQAPDTECSNPNHNVRVLLGATRGMRGPPGKMWTILREEPAWKKLGKDGKKNLLKTFVKLGKRHQKQLSDESFHGSSMNPTMLAPGKGEHKPLEPSLDSSMSIENKPKALPKKLDLASIPTFVPRNTGDTMLSGELVWSPTSGTRQRRPDEIYHQSIKARPVAPLQSKQGPHRRGHRHTDSIRRSPLPQFKSTQSLLNPSTSRPSNGSPHPRARRHNRSGDMSVPGNIDRMMEMTTLSRGTHSRGSSSSHFDTTAYPATNPSRTYSPSFRGLPYPSSQARDLFGADPFSAPPSIPGYGNLHQTGQGMYGGPPSPFQGQLPGSLPQPQSGPAPGFLHAFSGQVPHVPNPERWSAHPLRPDRGIFHEQTPNQIIQPVPQRMARSQIPPFMNQVLPPLSNEDLVVPPPGSMIPLEYWNMLHQREIEIRIRLQHANRPMTAHEYNYISLLGEARVNAAATQMPARNGMSKQKWLAELGRTQRGIWKTGPGGVQGYYSPVVAARKQDFDKAIQREIEFVEQEGRKFEGGMQHRVYGF